MCIMFYIYVRLSKKKLNQYKPRINRWSTLTLPLKSLSTKNQEDKYLRITSAEEENEMDHDEEEA